MLLDPRVSTRAPFLSFVICSRDDERFAGIQREIRSKVVLVDCEIVRITDATSLAEGYNRGYRETRGDWVIFCHDDIVFIDADTVLHLLRSFAQCDVLGLCGTSRLVSGNWYDAGPPFISGAVVAPSLAVAGAFELQIFDRRNPPLVTGAQAVDGIFIAARRKVLDCLQGFNERDFQDFVLYDVEFSFRAYLAGFQVAIATDILVFHDSHVGGFSHEKLQRWEDAQRVFTGLYGSYLFPPSGLRHDLRVMTAATREEALAIYQSIPASAVAEQPAAAMQGQ